MSIPFSKTRHSLLSELSKPLPAIMAGMVFWCALLLIWLGAAKITVTVVSETVQLEDGGSITAEFDVTTDIQEGQSARIELVGLSNNSMPATVINVQDTGWVEIAADNDADKLRILRDDIQIEQIEIVIDSVAPIMFLFR